MKWPGALAAALVLAAGVAAAQVPAGSLPEGSPRHGAELVDRDFGVRTDRFGLDRQVEMYQWLRVGQNRYEPAWKAAWVDSAGFAPGHDNPPEIPLESRRWWAEQATLDGYPIDPQVLKLLGRWEEFRPGFSRLPGNLSATFQPEGDGLTSSENPLQPRIGDLRVSWRELELPPLAGKVELVDGVWQIARRPDAATAGVPAAAGSPTAVAVQAPPQAGPGRWWPWLAGAGVLLVVVVLVARRR